jgi:hypothetical protein
MKKKNQIKIAIPFLAVILLLSGCLKDSRYVDYSDVGVLVELPLAEVNNYQEVSGPFETETYSLAKGATDTIIVAVNVASPKPLTTALSVTLTTGDLTALNAYNTANGTTLTPLPAADFSVIGSLTVTVPPNQRLAYATIVIKAKAMGVANSGNYVLPITISSASGEPIAQPEKALLYNIVITP